MFYRTPSDGGVYDNLGLEALYKIGRGLDKEIDFIIVSDASSHISFQKRKGTASIANMRRLLDISSYQVYALRSRELHANITEKRQGMHLKIGKHGSQIASDFGVEPIISDCLTYEETAYARDYCTTLHTPCRHDFDLILRHGYETAKFTKQFGEMSLNLTSTKRA